MKIGIIGASAAGLYTALLYLRRCPKSEVIIYDHADKVGKKLLATGNGHCNLMHLPFSEKAFNHPDFVRNLMLFHSSAEMMSALHELGIETLQKGELVYPLSFSAASHVRFLWRSAEKKGVKFRLEDHVKDVVGTTVISERHRDYFDKIVFAFGGKSQENLGSDGSMFTVLSRRGYSVTPLRPSLCPMYSPDVGKSLSSVRHGAKIRLMDGHHCLYEEEGELQFKKDGLSGIAVMNSSAYYVPGCMLTADLFPSIDLRLLTTMLQRSYERFGDDFLTPYMEKALMEFVLQNQKIGAESPLNQRDVARIAEFLKNMEFRIKGLYDFDSSQVTRGGIDINNVNSNLQSRIDANHYFVGECLDIDGLCGGYNLGFALLSAMVVGGCL